MVVECNEELLMKSLGDRYCVLQKFLNNTKAIQEFKSTDAVCVLNFNLIDVQDELNVN